MWSHAIWPSIPLKSRLLTECDVVRASRQHWLHDPFPLSWNNLLRRLAVANPPQRALRCHILAVGMKHFLLQTVDFVEKLESLMGEDCWVSLQAKMSLSDDVLLDWSRLTTNATRLLFHIASPSRVLLLSSVNKMHLKHNRKMTALVERFLRSLSIHLLVMFQSSKEGAFHANLVRIAAAHPIPSSVSVLARLV